MEGTDVFQYRDGDANHDHTYYGYGCPDTEGSGVSCNLLIINTSDNEPQSIGTYHNFPSATSGSGSTAVTDNSNATDTFCPLGWQLPYSGTGGDYYDQSRSFRYLFTTYGYTANADGYKILSYPISIVRSGRYYTEIGALFGADDVANIMSITAGSISQNYRADIRPDFRDFSYIVDKNSAYSVRYILGISNLKAFHGIRVRL